MIHHKNLPSTGLLMMINKEHVQIQEINPFEENSTKISIKAPGKANNIKLFLCQFKFGIITFFSLLLRTLSFISNYLPSLKPLFK